MNRRYLFSLGILAVALAMPALSQADIIFNNFGSGAAYNTSGGNMVGNAFDGNDYAEGDTFTPSSTAALSSIDIALSCSFLCPDSFEVALTSNNGDKPDTVLESFTVAGGSLGSLGSNNAPVVLNSVLNPALTAGTQYWIIVASDLYDSIAWNWNSTGDTADQAISTDGGTTWFSPSGFPPGAFEVNGNPVSQVPEPGSTVLLGSGLAGIAGVVRRRLKR